MNTEHKFKTGSAVTTAQMEIPPLNVAQTHPPEFLRLPPPGQLCAWTGLSRSAINELVLATPRNDFKPQVKSFCLRQRGAKTGIRLVDYSSLRLHILAHAEQSTESTSGD
jgi:hypothetical protein